MGDCSTLYALLTNEHHSADKLCSSFDLKRVKRKHWRSNSIEKLFDKHFTSDWIYPDAKHSALSRIFAAIDWCRSHNDGQVRTNRNDSKMIGSQNERFAVWRMWVAFSVPHCLVHSTSCGISNIEIEWHGMTNVLRNHIASIWLLSLRVAAAAVLTQMCLHSIVAHMFVRWTVVN